MQFPYVALVAANGSIHRRWQELLAKGAPSAAVYVTDSFREVFSSYHTRGTPVS